AASLRSATSSYPRDFSRYAVGAFGRKRRDERCARDTARRRLDILKADAMRFSIAGRPIGPDSPPYVVAEGSCNHQDPLTPGIEIARAAKAAGADAVKLQTFRPDTHTLDLKSDQFVVADGLWKGRSLYDLYCEAVTPWEWHAPLFDAARRFGITMFSSPGSEEA